MTIQDYIHDTIGLGGSYSRCIVDLVSAAASTSLPHGYRPLGRRPAAQRPAG